MRESIRQKLKGYAVAVLAVAVVAFLMIRLRGIWEQTGLLPLLAAVAVASWYGGLGPGLVSIAAAALFGLYYVIPPSDAFRIETLQDALWFSSFMLVAFLISSLHISSERAQRVWRQSEQRLEFALTANGIGCWDADIKAGKLWRSANVPIIFGRSDRGFATTCEGFFAYVYSEDRDFFRLATVRCDAGHTEYEITHRIVCGDGSVRWMKTRGQIFPGKRGGVERMVGVVHQLDQPLSEPPPGSAVPVS